MAGKAPHLGRSELPGFPLLSRQESAPMPPDPATAWPPFPPGLLPEKGQEMNFNFVIFEGSFVIFHFNFVRSKMP